MSAAGPRKLEARELEQFTHRHVVESEMTMTPRQHKKDLLALIEQIDATTEAVIAYEADTGVCSLSAIAKARLASARLALSTLIESVATELGDLSAAAKKLLARLRRKDLDYTRIDAAAYRELRERGLANVIFSSTGNRVLATGAGKETK